MYSYLKLSKTLENSVSYCYTSYEMTDLCLRFQIQINSYTRNSNTPYKSLIVTAGEFQKCNKDTLEERCAIKFCFKLGKNAAETYGMLQTAFEHLAWIEHQFWSVIGDLKKAGSLWGMMRGVRGVRKSIHQSCMVKGLELGLLCWGFKGVQEEFPSEGASTLQIRSLAFPSGQCTSPQLHPCHRLYDQDGHHGSSSPSL